MYYFEQIDKQAVPQTLEDGQVVMASAVQRYRNDSIFRGKVEMMTYHVLEVVRSVEGRKERFLGPEDHGQG